MSGYKESHNIVLVPTVSAESQSTTSVTSINLQSAQHMVPNKVKHFTNLSYITTYVQQQAYCNFTPHADLITNNYYIDQYSSCNMMPEHNVPLNNMPPVLQPYSNCNFTPDGNMSAHNTADTYLQQFNNVWMSEPGHSTYIQQNQLCNFISEPNVLINKSIHSQINPYPTCSLPNVENNTNSYVQEYTIDNMSDNIHTATDRNVDRDVEPTKHNSGPPSVSNEPYKNKTVNCGKSKTSETKRSQTKHDGKESEKNSLLKMSYINAVKKGNTNQQKINIENKDTKVQKKNKNISGTAISDIKPDGKDSQTKISLQKMKSYKNSTKLVEKELRVNHRVDTALSVKLTSHETVAGGTNTSNNKHISTITQEKSDGNFKRSEGKKVSSNDKDKKTVKKKVTKEKNKIAGTTIECRNTDTVIEDKDNKTIKKKVTREKNKKSRTTIECRNTDTVIEKHENRNKILKIKNKGSLCPESVGSISTKNKVIGVKKDILKLSAARTNKIMKLTKEIEKIEKIQQSIRSLSDNKSKNKLSKLIKMDSSISGLITQVRKHTNMYDKSLDARLPENDVTHQRSHDNVDLRTTLSRKRSHNDRYTFSKCPEENPRERENLLVTIQQDINPDMQSSQTDNTKPKTKKRKKLKLVINVICEESTSSESDENAATRAQLGNDLSFLDDFNIDEIVDSLNGNNCNEHSCNNVTINTCDNTCVSEIDNDIHGRNNNLTTNTPNIKSKLDEISIEHEDEQGNPSLENIHIKNEKVLEPNYEDNHNEVAVTTEGNNFDTTTGSNKLISLIKTEPIENYNTVGTHQLTQNYNNGESFTKELEPILMANPKIEGVYDSVIDDIDMILDDQVCENTQGTEFISTETPNEPIEISDDESVTDPKECTYIKDNVVKTGYETQIKNINSHKSVKQLGANTGSCATEEIIPMDCNHIQNEKQSKNKEFIAMDIKDEANKENISTVVIPGTNVDEIINNSLHEDNSDHKKICRNNNELNETTVAVGNENSDVTVIGYLESNGKEYGNNKPLKKTHIKCDISYGSLVTMRDNHLDKSNVTDITDGEIQNNDKGLKEIDSKCMSHSQSNESSATNSDEKCEEARNHKNDKIPTSTKDVSNEPPETTNDENLKNTVSLKDEADSNAAADPNDLSVIIVEEQIPILTISDDDIASIDEDEPLITLDKIGYGDENIENVKNQCESQREKTKNESQKSNLYSEIKQGPTKCKVGKVSKKAKVTEEEKSNKIEENVAGTSKDIFNDRISSRVKFMKDLPESARVFVCQIESRMFNLLAERYEFTSLLKKGRFSSIYKCTNSKREVCAVKVLNTNTGGPWSDHHSMGVMKVKMFHRLQSYTSKQKSTIVHMMTSFALKRRSCFVLEYYPKNLEQALIENKKCFHINLVQVLARQLVAAVIVLANNYIVHTDIKPAHILLNSTNDKLKLAGFDESTHIRYLNVVPKTGTANYRAPEIILGFTTDYRIDVWSTALVIFEMATGRKLFPGVHNNDILYKQICTLGDMPQDMIMNSAWSRYHFNGTAFLRIVGPKGKQIQVLNYIHKNNRLQSTLYDAYKANWQIYATRQEEYEDMVKLQSLHELLQQMLELDPRYRLPITFVGANSLFNTQCPLTYGN